MTADEPLPDPRVYLMELCELVSLALEACRDDELSHEDRDEILAVQQSELSRIQDGIKRLPGGSHA